MSRDSQVNVALPATHASANNLAQYVQAENSMNSAANSSDQNLYRRGDRGRRLQNNQDRYGTSSPILSTAVGSSRTLTMTIDPTGEDQDASEDRVGQDAQHVGYLYLVGQEQQEQEEQPEAEPISRPRLQWADDTIDNEHMNKKKSKICCIYRKPRAWDESDSDDYSSSCGSDSDSPNEYEKMPKYKPKHCHNHKHH